MILSSPLLHGFVHSACERPHTEMRQDWSQRVSLGNFDGYREKFETVASYFADQFPEARKIGNEMISTILERLEKQ